MDKHTLVLNYSPRLPTPRLEISEECASYFSVISTKKRGILYRIDRDQGTGPADGNEYCSLQSGNRRQSTTCG